MSRGHYMIPQFGLACPLYRRGYPSLLPCLICFFYETNNPSLLSCPAFSLRDRPSQSPVLSGLGQSVYPCHVQLSLYDIILSCPACPSTNLIDPPRSPVVPALSYKKISFQSLKSVACPRCSLVLSARSGYLLT